MNYDITMCRYDDCPLSARCRRYRTYETLMADTDPDRPRYVSMLHSDKRGKECGKFWDNSK